MQHAVKWKAATPWASERIPPHVARVPTMLRPIEGRFYQWLARTQTAADAAVVDLGAFVGGSSARLAHGLSQSGHAARLHVYDRFTASEALKQRMLYPAGVAPFPGEDTFELAKSHLAPWHRRITLHRGRIEDIGWCGDPIRVLCIDAFKSADATDAMVAQFFPSLVPGRSVVVHQDFLQPTQPWLVALMWALRDVFEPLAYVRHATIAFRCTRRILPSHLRKARVARLSDEDLLSAIAKSRRAYAGWGIGQPLRRMETVLQASPGCRVAHMMTHERKRFAA
ncbi:hypothetical protein ILP92_15480 [Maribius pontilimi]|uniref:Uncharacterized protein n=1 Tax=Palleronia pontilimi TaxID=1964209 RepID=A0A934IKC2_9RHOB|nr:hypothetical protein [Palleronia pontilimi]MBJ3764150.1 hypothetical protein [Palleronia pontilimi]